RSRHRIPTPAVSNALTRSVQTIALEGPGIVEVTAIRARWLGHRVHAEVTVSVDAGLTVSSGHELAESVETELIKAIPVLSGAAVHLHQAGAVL
ncbi:MAG: cation transporter dimerization domain-containing protein, partial [Kofleriaceae bacterium]